ncbi:MAG: GTP cyclohydrolase II [Gammaproteobacteria bacterium]
MTLRFVESARLPTPFGEFELHGFEDEASGKEHVMLTLGDVGNGDPVLLRIHSECLTGDALFSLRCDCGPQLEAAMERIGREGRGIILYLRQEGRGIGLTNKIRAYKLQDEGKDTVEANVHLGFDADLRDYTICKTMLDSVGALRLRLMTNNPRKVDALKALGFECVERIPHEIAANPHNEHYLQIKKGKLGHLFGKK